MAKKARLFFVIFSYSERHEKKESDKLLWSQIFLCWQRQPHRYPKVTQTNTGVFSACTLILKQRIFYANIWNWDFGRSLGTRLKQQSLATENWIKSLLYVGLSIMKQHRRLNIYCKSAAARYCSPAPTCALACVVRHNKTSSYKQD